MHDQLSAHRQTQLLSYLTCCRQPCEGKESKDGSPQGTVRCDHTKHRILVEILKDRANLQWQQKQQSTVRLLLIQQLATSKSLSLGAINLMFMVGLVLLCALVWQCLPIISNYSLCLPQVHNARCSRHCLLLQLHTVWLHQPALAILGCPIATFATVTSLLPLS